MRITVTLIPTAEADLERLRAVTGLSVTDLVNRAVSLYRFAADELAAGRALVVEDGGKRFAVELS